MLSKLDDYPVHQNAEALIHKGTADQNAYDRYWFNGVARDGSYYFGAALGLYPNLSVMDAHFSILQEGEQHALHASRRAPREPTETTVGPIQLEVVEPMRTLRLTIAPNPHGIEAELLFRARTPAVEEERATSRDGDGVRTLLDMTRFTQFGRWEGRIKAGGVETNIADGSCFAARDRSWGVRPVGARPPGKPEAPPQVCWLWAPIHFEKECRLHSYFQNAEGKKRNACGMRVPASVAPALYADPGDEGFVALQPTADRLEFIPGGRFIKRAEFDITPAEGAPYTLQLETQMRFNLNGLAYLNPPWAHGLWQGELKVGAEHWKESELSAQNPLHQHIHNLVRATIKGGEYDGLRGMGTLESLIMGPCASYGFTQLVGDN